MTSDSNASGPDAPPAVPGGAVRMPPGARRYAAVLDRLDQVVFQTDPDGNWTYLNAAWERLLGYRVEDSLGTHFLDYLHPDEREPTIELFQRVIQSRATHCHHEARYRGADGVYRWVELRAATLVEEDGRYVGNVGTLLDITDRREAQEILVEEARILKLVATDLPLQHTVQAIAEVLARRLDTQVTLSSFPAIVRPVPRRHATPATALRVSVTAGEGANENGGPPARTLPVRSPTDGSRIGSCALRDAGHLSAAGEDLVDRCLQLAAIAIESSRAQEEARHLALHDPLTGLPNRTLVVDRLHQALGLARRHGEMVAVLVLDLDSFKTINDSWGHEAGDWVLRSVSARLDEALRQSDTVCRLGGDEFTIVLPEVSDADEAQRVARKVRAAISAPLAHGDVHFRIEASVGVAVSTSEVGEDPQEFIRRADAAMYRAKRLGTGLAMYAPTLDEPRIRGFGLVGELRRAIEGDELRLEYQPKVHVLSGRVVGVECLVRWEHPTRGTVAPGDFIPLAETTGTIKPLSHWVLRTAVKESRSWRQVGLGGALAVNVSAQTLHDPGLPDMIEVLLDDRDASRPDLELEVTESAVMADPESAIAAMTRLGEAGVRFAIDDFGTGYSSLAYLKRLPAHVIKIDKSFVRQMDRDDRDASIVRSAIDLAHNLGIDVVAEGVETARVCELLEGLRCDCIQGFYLAPPMPAEDLFGWLRDREPQPC